MSTPGQPPWYQACLDAIAELGSKPCDETFCAEQPVRQYAHAFCTCQEPYPNGCAGPNPPPDCCEFSQASPVPILEYGCFCCCGMLGASEVPVAADATTYRPIKEYQVGDPVHVADGATLESWSQRPVQWSGGV